MFAPHGVLVEPVPLVGDAVRADVLRIRAPGGAQPRVGAVIVREMDAGLARFLL